MQTEYRGARGRSPKNKFANKSAELLRSVALGVALTVLPAFLPVEEAQAQRVIQIAGSTRTVSVNVPVGKNEDVRVDSSFVEMTVGDPEVADVHPLTDKALSILGKKIGTTRVSIYGEGKKLLGIFDVEVTYDVSRLQTEIARVTRSGIKVSSVNGRIMLSGSVHDAVTLDRAVVLARQFAPDIINSVVVDQPQQVMLEVRFVEVSREAGRELGVQWNVWGPRTTGHSGARLPANQLPLRPPTDPKVLAAGEVAAGVLSGTAPFGVLVHRMIAAGVTTDVFINALEQRGLARSLAEPNLVALSGDTASFLAGGEFPVPVPGSLGAISIEYKRYGVGLAFTPTVLNGGLVNLKIEPEVSQLDRSNPVQVAGISVPPLIVRRASTTVELRDGQSFVIGGLLQNTSTTAQQQLPWLGDVPVLGALFRSARYQKNETDLAIIVTPRIVRPARPGDVIKVPTDGTLPANDADFFLLGKSELTPTEARLSVGLSRPYVGHIIDLPKVRSAGGGHVIAARN